MQSINKAYLLIGSNLGNRLFYLKQAVSLIIRQCGKISQQSGIYETAPWGNIKQEAFLNQALELDTFLRAEELILQLLSIEEKIGRKRLDKYGPRIIDIDILLFNEEVYSTSHLIIPHEELPNRKFALQPLADIAGEIVHPVLKKTIRQLLIECRDELPVNKVSKK